MKHHLRALMCGSIVLVAGFAAACGGKESMASKSAAAYRDAQAKGVPVGSGGAHGGHQAGATTGTGEAGAEMKAMDHSTMTGMNRSQTSGMDHSQMAGKAGMTHSTTSGAGRTNASSMQHDMSTMSQGSSAKPEGSMAGMQHGSPAPANLTIGAPTSNSAIASIRPGATLRPDDFDAPVPIAVAEASRAASGMSQGQPASDTEPVIYTCPMHPEVTSATPGKCPKCGMTLVKKEQKK